MSAGKYRHEIRIEERTETTTDAGQVKASGWATFLDGLFAEVVWPSGDEPMRGSQRRAILNPEVRMRWTVETATITAQHRVVDVCHSRTLAIKAVQDVTGRERELVLECVEDVSQGGPNA